MKDYGKQRSTVKPDEVVIDKYSVWIYSDIQEVCEHHPDSDENFVEYEFNMIQYTKDEYSKIQEERIAELEAQNAELQANLEMQAEVLDYLLMA